MSDDEGSYEEDEYVYLQTERNKLHIEKELIELRVLAQNKDLEYKRQQLKIENDLNEQIQKKNKRKLEETIGMLKLEKEAEELQYKIAKHKMQHKADLIDAELHLRERELAYSEWTHTNIQRLENPLKDGPSGEKELILSDRIVELYGVVTYVMAEHLTVRINYYNNQDPTLPIFMIVDSPGGSVMAGLEIINLMQYSQAPIYVVIKGWAASMAAVIAACSDHSYIYKDARILHHQIASFTMGNLTHHSDKLKWLQDLTERTDKPMLKKINDRLKKLDSDQEWTTDEWNKAIHDKTSSHDWIAYGDEAVQLGWVEGIVHSIQYTSQVRHPDAKYSKDKKVEAPAAPALPSKSKLAAEQLRFGDCWAVAQTTF